MLYFDNDSIGFRQTSLLLLLPIYSLLCLLRLSFFFFFSFLRNLDNNEPMSFLRKGGIGFS